MEKEMMIETSNLIKDINFHEDKKIKIQKEISDKIYKYLGETNENNFQAAVDLKTKEYSGVLIRIGFDDYIFYYNNGTLTYEPTSDELKKDVKRIVYLSGIVSNALLTLEYEVKKQ